MSQVWGVCDILRYKQVAEKAPTEEAVWSEGDTLIMEPLREEIFLERKVKGILQPV